MHSCVLLSISQVKTKMNVTAIIRAIKCCLTITLCFNKFLLSQTLLQFVFIWCRSLKKAVLLMCVTWLEVTLYSYFTYLCGCMDNNPMKISCTYLVITRHMYKLGCECCFKFDSLVHLVNFCGIEGHVLHVTPTDYSSRYLLELSFSYKHWFLLSLVFFLLAWSYQ
jgi:hypothetical protein